MKLLFKAIAGLLLIATSSCTNDCQMAKRKAVVRQASVQKEDWVYVDVLASCKSPERYCVRGYVSGDLFFDKEKGWLCPIVYVTKANDFSIEGKSEIRSDRRVQLNIVSGSVPIADIKSSPDTVSYYLSNLDSSWYKNKAGGSTTGFWFKYSDRKEYYVNND